MASAAYLHEHLLQPAGSYQKPNMKALQSQGSMQLRLMITQFLNTLRSLTFNHDPARKTAWQQWRHFD